MPIRFGLCVAAAVATLTSAIPSFAQSSWPQRAVRLIAPLPPGTAVDISARLFAERLSQKWGQGVVVENRRAPTGLWRSRRLLGAGDGHTLLISFGGVTTLNPLVHKNLQYDPRDLVPITLVVDNYLGRRGVLRLEGEFGGGAGEARQAPRRASTPGRRRRVRRRCSCRRS